MSETMSSSSSTHTSTLTAAELAEWSQSLQPVVLGLSVTMLVLGNLGVMLRIWAQWRIQKRPMQEDYWLVVAVVRVLVVILCIHRLNRVTDLPLSLASSSSPTWSPSPP